MSQLHRQIRELCDRYGLDLMYTFGSRSQEIINYFYDRGELNRAATADVDIGAKVKKGSTLSAREKVSLAIELEELLGAARVDLVILSEAGPFLAANIIRGERIFCRDAYLGDEYELYVLRRAGDLAPLERERLDMIFSAGT
ncbi:MAG: nucleotidyltransferase domain-containing protein [Deltaproteobacteria bacterium]|jgi:hypothetical protein